MGTTISSDALLESLGFSENESYDLPEDLNELSVSSLRAFIGQSYLEHSSESSALIHITGPSVIGHSAPLRSVGDFMTQLQSTFEAVGASIEGFKALSGTIPSKIAKRTELALVASPLPGSVVLEVAPSMPRVEDFRPNGEPALFDVETTIDAKTLADCAFEEFSNLLSDLSCETPDQDAFVEHLAELGPRVASNVQSLCETVDKSQIDVDFEWREPFNERKTISVSHSFAKYAASVIQDAQVNVEQIHIEGVLLTVTTSEKDHLRIREDVDGGLSKETILPIGDIPSEQLYGLQPGDKVAVDAEKQLFTRAGGRTRQKLVGVGISKIDQLG